MIRKIVIFLAIVFIAIQFVPVDWNTTDEVTANDFIVATNAPVNISNLLKTSCYDCHSNNTVYPWYDKIAPVSWWINGHVDHGKGELNLSEWETFSEKKKRHKLKEIVEEVEKRKMPLDSYLIMHGDAELSEEQIENLKKWIETIK